MPDNPSNDPQLDEACRQVGRFMYHFALLEEAMNALMGRALDLKEDQTTIVGAQVPLYKKVKLIQAAIQAQSRGEAWKQAAVSTLNKISCPNDQRNVVAHYAFSGDPSGGVVFHRTRTHDKSKSPAEKKVSNFKPLRLTSWFGSFRVGKPRSQALSR